MTVFSYTLKRLLRNKLNLLAMLVVPSLAIGLVFGFGNWGTTTLSVGLVDLDNTPLTQMLAESLAENSLVLFLEEEQIRTYLANGKADYILVIEPGLTEAILNNQDPILRGYSIQETNLASPVKFKAESFLSAAKGLAVVAGGDSVAFYRGLEDYRDGSFVVARSSYSETGRRVDAALGGIGLLSMTMMLLTTYVSITLLTDRKNRTLFRVLASPLSLKKYMLQSILSFIVVSLVQISIVLLTTRFMYGIYLGPSVLNLFVVLAVFALVLVAMGVALSSLVRTLEQAGTIATLVITPMAMLGGLFWPREMMPEILQTVGQFLPTSWVMEAARKVMLGNPLSAVAMELSILLGFALVFFLLGTWKRVDVAK